MIRISLGFFRPVGFIFFSIMVIKPSWLNPFEIFDLDDLDDHD
jgi:hypothetical protein